MREKRSNVRRLPSLRQTERYEYFLLELHSKTRPVDVQRATKEVQETAARQAIISFRWRRGYSGAWTLR